jgi:hypothetical protein
MNQTAEIAIENITHELFEKVLLELTIMIATTHFKQQFNKENIYNHIGFRDNNNRNLEVTNLMLIA